MYQRLIECFADDCRHLPQSRRPICVKAGPQKIYFVFGPENVRQLFSTKETNQKARVADLFGRVGMSQDDLDRIAADESGELQKPRVETPEDKRIFRHTVESFSNGLAAVNVSRQYADRFTMEMTGRLRKFSEKEYTSVPIYKMLKSEMVFATGITFHGELIFKENPDFPERVWGFDEAFPVLMLSLPRWLTPKKYAYADRMREAVQKWYKAAYAIEDPRTPTNDIWGPVWGTQFWRGFVSNFLRAGISLDGAAAGSISTLWA